MMWGSDYPHSESTFPQSRKILAEIWPGCRTMNSHEDQRSNMLTAPPYLAHAYKPADVLVVMHQQV
jgi:hypothetical protein